MARQRRPAESARRKLNPRKLALIRQVAQLRAEGWSWKAIGQKVRRSPDNLRRWPQRFARVWTRAYLRAETAQLTDLGAEARLVLQKLMRSGDEKLQASAARFLSQLRTAQLRQPPREAAGAGTLAQELGERPITGNPTVDEVLEQLIEYLGGHCRRAKSASCGASEIASSGASEIASSGASEIAASGASEIAASGASEIASSGAFVNPLLPPEATTESPTRE